MEGVGVAMSIFRNRGGAGRGRVTDRFLWSCRGNAAIPLESDDYQ